MKSKILLSLMIGMFILIGMGMVNSQTITNYAYDESGNGLGTIANGVLYNQDGWYDFDGIANHNINIGALGIMPSLYPVLTFVPVGPS